jgi:hypothetical protein
METVTHVPATAAEIRRVVGDLDDVVVAAILRTNASTEQVLEAVRWLHGEGEEPLHGVVRAVHDILEAEEPTEA